MSGGGSWNERGKHQPGHSYEGRWGVDVCVCVCASVGWECRQSRRGAINRDESGALETFESEPIHVLRDRLYSTKISVARVWRGCAKGRQGWKESAVGERGTILNLNAFCTVQRVMRTRSYQLFFPGEASSLFRRLIEEQSFNFAEITPPACIDRSSR